MGPLQICHRGTRQLEDDPRPTPIRPKEKQCFLEKRPKGYLSHQGNCNSLTSNVATFLHPKTISQSVGNSPTSTETTKVEWSLGKLLDRQRLERWKTGSVGPMAWNLFGITYFRGSIHRDPIEKQQTIF